MRPGPEPSRAQETDEPDRLAGQLLAGRYFIERALATGGMGRVYLATQLPLRRRVAIKVISPKRASEREFKSRFFLEAATCAQLSHPNIVTVHDYGEAEDGGLFMAMEYLEGAALSDVLDANGPLGAERTLTIAVQVCRALREAHAFGAIHRDLKPGNVMLLDAREENAAQLVKVLDFGLVKVIEGGGGFGLDDGPRPGRGLTKTGVLMGSPRYMAPEQVRNEALDHRTDLYALGVIMYELIQGVPPFADRETLVDALHATLHAEPAPLAACPPDLAAIIGRCLRKEPAERFGSADELLRALKEALLACAGPGASFLPGLLGRSTSRSDLGRPAGADLTAPALTANPHLVADLTAPALTASPQLVADRLDALTGTSSPGAPFLPRDTLALPASEALTRPAGARPNRWVYIGLAAALAVAAVAIARVGPRRGAGEDSEPPTSSVHRAEPGERAADSAKSPEPVAPLELQLSSTPPGADIYEGNRHLGKTPASVPLDPAQKRDRFLIVQKAGYVPHKVAIGPGTTSVAHHVELEPRRR